MNHKNQQYEEVEFPEISELHVLDENRRAEKRKAKFLKKKNYDDDYDYDS